MDVVLNNNMAPSFNESGFEMNGDMVQKYAVHIYTQVRVKITGVQAKTREEAIEKADAIVDFYDLLDNKQLRVSKHSLGGGVEVEAAEWAEHRHDFFLVDPLLGSGDVDYANSCWFGPDGLPLVDGKTSLEQKAAGADLAGKFMHELLDSVETLTGVAESHGARTLADLMYLQQAIMKGGFIDHCPGESQVLEIVRALPSGPDWEKFVVVVSA